MSRERILLVILAVCLVLPVNSFSAPDPGALKVQGPDTLGTALPIVVAQPGAAGLTVTPITSSASAGNTTNTATLSGAAGLTTYITGFECTATGSTAFSGVTVTVANTVSGNMLYTFLFPGGVNNGAQPLVVQFTTPIPANAQNTSITVTLPAGGAGNVNASVTAHGFRM